MIVMNDHSEFVDADEPRFLKLRGNVGKIRADFEQSGQSYDWDGKRRKTRKCKNCGMPIDPRKHSTAIYCSDKCCQEQAYIMRRRVEGKAVKDGAKRYCERCGKPIDKSKRVDARFCSKRCKIDAYNEQRAKRKVSA